MADASRCLRASLRSCARTLFCAERAQRLGGKGPGLLESPRMNDPALDLAIDASPQSAGAGAKASGKDAVRVSVIVPTLNEVDNVGVLVDELARAFADESYGCEILVADGGSKDGTRAKVASLRSPCPLRLIECSSGGGLAGDVLEAARQARGDVVVVIDADLSHPPSRAPELARAVLEGRADMAIGSRYCKGGSTPGWPTMRRLMSRAAGLLVWPLQDARDPMAGFFAVSRERMLATCAQARGFKLGLELLLRGGENLRVSEFPIAFHDRERGESKMNSAQVQAYVRGVVRLVAGEAGQRTAARLALVSIIGLFVDLVIFRLLLGTQAGLQGAQTISFLAASLATYFGHAWWGMRTAGHEAVELDWRAHLRFMAVASMAFALRAAVIGHGLGTQSAWQLTLPLAIAAAALVQYLGSFFFVFRGFDDRQGTGLRWRLAVVGLFAYLLVLRLAYLGLPTLLVEEAYYWNYAQHPALSYLDHPPMVAVLIGAGTWLFGDTEFGVRIPALLCSLVWTWFGYRMACNLFDRAVGLRSALLLASLPLFFTYGFFMTPDSPLLACWAGALFFLERALLGGKRSAWYGLGICLGLGMLSKYTIVLLVPATVLFVLIDARSRVWLARKEPYLALALALAIFSPVLIWNATHDWASFVFQGPRRMAADTSFGLHVLAGSVLLVLGPTALAAAIQALRARARVGSADVEFASERSRILFTRLLLLLPVAVFAAFSLTHSPKLNWTGPAWLVVLPWIAYHTMDDRRREPAARRGWLARAWAPTFAGLAVIYGIGLQVLVVGAPGLDNPANAQLHGWPDLASRIELIENAIELETGQEPLVVGMDKYNIAAELAFYRTHLNRNGSGHERAEGVQATTGRQWFGKQSLMFRFWPVAGAKEGRTLIMVDDELKDLEGELVSSSFERLTPVTRIVTEHNGKRAKEFFYRIGYGFRPPEL